MILQCMIFLNMYIAGTLIKQDKLYYTVDFHDRITPRIQKIKKDKCIFTFYREAQ